MIRAALVLFTLLSLVTPAHAQSGALFLLVPFGARAVAQGDAVAADTALGSESVWWNPAGAARGARREIAVHHNTTFASTNDMVAFVIPSKMMGTVSGAFYLANYGDLPVTEGPGVELGIASTHNYMAALSYASEVGSRLSVGLTYKFLMLRFLCSGYCPFPTFTGSTSAVDLGIQYRVPVSMPMVVGASLRNLGPPLQVKDREQADPLPRQFQIGGRARLPIPLLARNESSLDIMADLKQSEVLGGLAGGVGAVVSYREEFFLRTGYYKQPGEGSGPSIGLGAELGNFTLDIARRFDRISSEIGQTPTFISLGVRF